MRSPIAYTYEADTHCPPCAVARFGMDPGYPCPEPEPHDSARDSEGNPIGAVAPWDEWCEPSEPGPHVLTCGTCGGTIEEHDGPPDRTLCAVCGEPQSANPAFAGLHAYGPVASHDWSPA